MKKIIVICCIFLLSACAKNPEITNESKRLPISELYEVREGVINEDQQITILNKRLAAINSNELEEVVYVYENNEKRITSPDELQKFKDYMAKIKLTSDRTVGPSAFGGLGVKVKDKEMILLNILGNRICLSNMKCNSFNQEESLQDLLNSLEGESKAVRSFTQNAIVVDFISWADDKEIPEEVIEEVPSEDLPTNSYQEPISLENEELFITDWYDETDEWRKVLKMFFYIQEDFTDYREIEGIKDLISGLINQCDGYSNMGSNNFNTYVNQYGVEILMEKKHNKLKRFGIPDLFYLYPEIDVERMGKQLLSNDFTLPYLGNVTLSTGIMRHFEAYQDQHYFVNHLPYEYMFGDFEKIYLESMVENGNRRTYKGVKFLLSYDFNENLATQVILNQDGKHYPVDDTLQESTMQQIIEDHLSEFDQWEYVIEKNDEGHIKLVSAKRIVEGKGNYSTAKIDENKPDYYEEDQKIIINHQTKDALSFNQELRADDNIVFKVNENEGLLTIVSRSINPVFVTNVSVFDTITWNHVPDDEILQRLNINLDQMNKALIEVIPECANQVCYSLEEESRVHQYLQRLPKNEFLISSDGKFGVHPLISKEIILFDWEEVQ